MSNILLVYASTTGNTEVMAEAIADYLIVHGQEVVIKSFDFDRIDVEMIADYDAVLVGTHTWDDGDLPYEVEDFYEDLGDVDIKGIPFGVFGSADSFYDTYGGAVDLMSDRIKNLGGHLLPRQLKVDREPDRQDIEQCQKFAEMMIHQLNRGIKQQEV
ncbi:MAG TPA: flavodoxin, partial [Virgibacillus sp.]|nr:flavodoxin [Virgibacillus sp.]